MSSTITTTQPAPTPQALRIALAEGATNTDITTLPTKPQRAAVRSTKRPGPRQWKTISRSSTSRADGLFEDTDSVVELPRRRASVKPSAKLASPTKCARPVFAVTADQLMAFMNTLAKNGVRIPPMQRSICAEQEIIQAPAQVPELAPAAAAAASPTNNVTQQQNERAESDTLSVRETRGVFASMRAGISAALERPLVQAALTGPAVCAATLWAAPIAVTYLGVTGAQQLAVAGATSVLAAVGAATVINHPAAVAAACIGTVLGAAAVALAAPAAAAFTVLAGAAAGCVGSVGLYNFAGGLQKTVEYISWGIFGLAVTLALVSTGKVAAGALAAA